MEGDAVCDLVLTVAENKNEWFYQVLLAISDVAHR